MNLLIVLLGFLLNILPQILELIEKLFKQGKQLSPAQIERMDRCTGYWNRIHARAVMMGCSAQGTPPE
jgi:hypothetical protein